MSLSGGLPKLGFEGPLSSLRVALALSTLVVALAGAYSATQAAVAAGAIWTTQTTANPTPRAEAKFEDVSCQSTSLCVAAGVNNYTQRGFGRVWNGSSWSDGGGTLFSLKDTTISPHGIACPSSTYCFVVGSTGSGQTMRPAGEYWESPSSVWEGSTLSVPNPEGATYTVLNEVSCTSTTACTAVGSYAKEAMSQCTLAERWNGSAWSIQTTPNPASGSAELLGVSCDSSRPLHGDRQERRRKNLRRALERNLLVDRHHAEPIRVGVPHSRRRLLHLGELLRRCRQLPQHGNSQNDSIRRVLERQRLVDPKRPQTQRRD